MKLNNTTRKNDIDKDSFDFRSHSPDWLASGDVGKVERSITRIGFPCTPSIKQPKQQHDAAQMIREMIPRIKKIVHMTLLIFHSQSRDSHAKNPSLFEHAHSFERQEKSFSTQHLLSVHLQSSRVTSVTDSVKKAVPKNKNVALTSTTVVFGVAQQTQHLSFAIVCTDKE